MSQLIFEEEQRTSWALEEGTREGARIKVVGIGGGGCNAINRMIEAGIEGVDFIAGNTDLQALRHSHASVKLQLGTQLTKGLGAGSDPEVGRKAALEDTERIIELLEGADMVFVTGGLGGGTGTGGAPIAASLAAELGALTVAVVTKPFNFEGKRRMHQAEQGLSELKDSADTVITIPNEKLLSALPPGTSLMNAFKFADDVLCQAVQGISDLINVPGVINLDFADIKTIMSGMGMALMGTGTAEGEDRAVSAARKAVHSPLLEDATVKGAQGVLINVTGSHNLTLHEVSEANYVIQDSADPHANIIFGSVFDETMGEKVKITVIATGFGDPPQSRLDGQGSTSESQETPRPRALPGREAAATVAYASKIEREAEIPAFLRRGQDS